MPRDELTETIDETLTLLLEVADEYIDEIAEQLEEVGSPEKLIDKPYEQWTPRDRFLLSQVYGTEEPNKLSDLIFKKEYEAVQKLEEEM